MTWGAGCGFVNYTDRSCLTVSREEASRGLSIMGHFKCLRRLARCLSSHAPTRHPDSRCVSHHFTQTIPWRHSDDPGVLPLLFHGQACTTPDKVLRAHLASGQHELLVHWVGQSVAATTSYMPLEEFGRLYPLFQLGDELIFHGGEMSWSGYTTTSDGQGISAEPRVANKVREDKR